MKEDIKKIINSIKLLGIDMIDEAKSGHPGIVLGAAPILYTLYAYHLKYNPKDPKWINRDRFVMSAGHGSALLYSTLFMAGYDLKIEDLMKFRQIDSITPGHPELNKTPGIDYSTGPLGQGFAASVGMAMAEKYLSTNLNNIVSHQRLIDHNIYCLVSDGDLQEGISYEAAALAGLYNLGNLIVLYDSNDITLDSTTAVTSKENILKRFDACGWQTDFVADGTNVSAIDKAIKRAKRVSNKPSIIEIKTIIGQDSFNQGTNIVHGKPLSKDDYESLHKALNLSNKKFEVTKEYQEKFQNIINKRLKKTYANWTEYYNEFKKVNNNEIQKYVKFFENKDLSLLFDSQNFKIKSTYEEELRESNSKIMNIISDRTKFFLGGSADLSSSCKTYLNKESDFSSKNYSGRNIFFGIREHAMATIINGMSTYGLLTYSSTFLRFLDYQKDSIRSAAMMNLPSTFIFTHDSVEIGEDGPSHEPIEQLATLRSIPNLDVYRPGDINEIIGSWECITTNKKPSSLIISKEFTHILGGTDSSKVKYGAYIVRKELDKLDAIIITSGRELTTCLIIAEELKEQYKIRVVSMVSQEIYDIQNPDYKQQVLPSNTKVISIEPSNSYSFTKYTPFKYCIGLNTFGYSGKPKDVLKKLQFDKDSLKEKVIELIKD